MLALDFSVVERGIVQALKAATQAGPDAWCRVIGTRAEMAAVAEEAQLAPALWVVYDSFSVLSATEFEAELLHRWFVVLAVSTAQDPREAAPRHQLAAPRLAELITLLHGLVPEGSSTPLVLATPPRPYYSDAKFAYFPLAFTHQTYHCKGT